MESSTRKILLYIGVTMLVALVCFWALYTLITAHNYNLTLLG